jgi:hypothetical protein
LTEGIAHIVHLISQAVASLFSDEEKSPTIIGREQRKAQSLVQRQQIAILITGKTYREDTLEQDNPYRQQTEVQGSPMVLTSIQQII